MQSVVRAQRMQGQHCRMRPHARPGALHFSSRGVRGADALRWRAPAFDAFKSFLPGQGGKKDDSAEAWDEGADMVPIGESGGVGGVSEEAFGPLVSLWWDNWGTDVTFATRRV